MCSSQEKGMLFFSPYKYREQLYLIIYGQAIPSVIGQKSVALTSRANWQLAYRISNHSFQPLGHKNTREHYALWLCNIIKLFEKISIFEAILI